MKLKTLRTQRGLSQEVLAKRVKVTQPYITMMESGAFRNPTLDDALRRSLPRFRLPFDTVVPTPSLREARRSVVELSPRRAKSFQLPATTLLPEHPDPGSFSTTSITPISCVSAQIQAPGSVEFGQQGIS